MVKGHILAALLLTGKCLASPHHLFTSSFATPHLYALEFDDETNSIVDIANITAHDGHPWISFSYDKSSLYAGESDGFTSYTVENSSSLIYSQSVKVSVECGGKKDELGSPYVVAELRAPFSVFGASSTGCGAAMSVDSDGKLQSLVQSFKYRDGSSIKGLALDPDNKYLYSADESNNGIWIHLVTDQGTVNQVGFSPSPIANSGPKHLIIHPDGRYLYAVMSRTNVVAVFAINSGAGSDISRLTYTRLTYSLTPPGKDRTNSQVSY
jgi:carboxy-cis,cis-muconate cyclase